MMKFGKLTESTAMTFLEYIEVIISFKQQSLCNWLTRVKYLIIQPQFQRNLPEGMAMKVTKHERKKLPEIIEAHIVESTSTPSQN